MVTFFQQFIFFSSDYTSVVQHIIIYGCKHRQINQVYRVDIFFVVLTSGLQTGIFLHWARQSANRIKQCLHQSVIKEKGKGQIYLLRNSTVDRLKERVPKNSKHSLTTASVL